MLNFTILAKALEEKRKKESKIDFDASQHLRGIEKKYTIIETYFVKDPLPQVSVADIMFNAVDFDEIVIPLSVYDLLDKI